MKFTLLQNSKQSINVHLKKKNTETETDGIVKSSYLATGRGQQYVCGANHRFTYIYLYRELNGTQKYFRKIRCLEPETKTELECYIHAFLVIIRVSNTYCLYFPAWEIE